MGHGSERRPAAVARPRGLIFLGLNRMLATLLSRNPVHRLLPWDSLRDDMEGYLASADPSERHEVRPSEQHRPGPLAWTFLGPVWLAIGFMAIGCLALLHDASTPLLQLLFALVAVVGAVSLVNSSTFTFPASRVLRFARHPVATNIVWCLLVVLWWLVLGVIALF